MLYLLVHILCFILLLHYLDVNIKLLLSPLRVWLTQQSVFCCTYFFYKHLNLMQTCNSLHKQNAWVRMCNSAAGRATRWLRPNLHVVLLLHNLLNCDVLCLQYHLECLIRQASRGLSVKVVSCSVLFVNVHVLLCTSTSFVSRQFHCDPLYATRILVSSQLDIMCTLLFVMNVFTVALIVKWEA